MTTLIGHASAKLCPDCGAWMAIRWLLEVRTTLDCPHGYWCECGRLEGITRVPDYMERETLKNRWDLVQARHKRYIAKGAPYCDAPDGLGFTRWMIETKHDEEDE